MDGSLETQSWLQWVLSAIVGLALAVSGYTNRRISKAEEKASDDDDKIWAAHESERALNTSFRERFSGTVAALPTKEDLAKMEKRSRDDLAQMETRIMGAIHGRR